MISSVSLPPMLYKPYEKKEGDDSQVSFLLESFNFFWLSQIYESLVRAEVKVAHSVSLLGWM